jgi:hypothetical protein
MPDQAEPEFEVMIHVRMRGTESQVNDRIDKALDRAFPSTRKDVLALSWESREDKWNGGSFESLAAEGGIA